MIFSLAIIVTNSVKSHKKMVPAVFVSMLSLLASGRELLEQQQPKQINIQ
jgi:hypothetical protein